VLVFLVFGFAGAQARMPWKRRGESAPLRLEDFGGCLLGVAFTRGKAGEVREAQSKEGGPFLALRHS